MKRWGWPNIERISTGQKWGSKIRPLQNKLKTENRTLTVTIFLILQRFWAVFKSKNIRILNSPTLKFYESENQLTIH